MKMILNHCRIISPRYGGDSHTKCSENRNAIFEYTGHRMSNATEFDTLFPITVVTSGDHKTDIRENKVGYGADYFLD